MPTARPRHQVTETSAVARALDAAAREWPAESRAQLLVRLIRAGGDALERGHTETAHRRREAVDASSGKYGNAFPADHLAELRRDWPE